MAEDDVALGGNEVVIIPPLPRRAEPLGGKLEDMPSQPSAVGPVGILHACVTTHKPPRSGSSRIASNFDSAYIYMTCWGGKSPKHLKCIVFLTKNQQTKTPECMEKSAMTQRQSRRREHPTGRRADCSSSAQRISFTLHAQNALMISARAARWLSEDLDGVAD